MFKLTHIVEKNGEVVPGRCDISGKVAGVWMDRYDIRLDSAKRLGAVGLSDSPTGVDTTTSSKDITWMDE